MVRRFLMFLSLDVTNGIHLLLVSIFKHLVPLFRNKYCGKLYCEGGANFPILGSLASAQRAVLQGHECKAASVDQGNDVPDPGYVVTGSLCDEGMVSDRNFQIHTMRENTITVKCYWMVWKRCRFTNETRSTSAWFKYYKSQC